MGRNLEMVLKQLVAFCYACLPDLIDEVLAKMNIEGFCFLFFVDVQRIVLALVGDVEEPVFYPCRTTVHLYRAFTASVHENGKRASDVVAVRLPSRNIQDYIRPAFVWKRITMQRPPGAEVFFRLFL